MQAADGAASVVPLSVVAGVSMLRPMRMGPAAVRTRIRTEMFRRIDYSDACPTTGPYG